MTSALTLASLPLFPLQSTLCPEGSLSLQVFEVRYLDMVRKCQAAQAPFGVVALTHGSEVRKAGAPAEQFFSIGTLAHIEELHTPQPGLITLTCRGRQRFRIHHHHQLPHGLWVADVVMVDHDPHITIPTDLQSIASALEQVLFKLHHRDTGISITPKAAATADQLADCGWVANRWCELLPISMELKQRLMELDNPLLRLELVGDVLDKTGIAPH